MGKPGGRSAARRKERWEKWEKRKVQLTMWNQEERQQQQQQQLLINKERKQIERLQKFHVRLSQQARARMLEIEKERKRQEKVPPSPRRSPRICPHPSLVSPSFVMCAVAC